MIHEHISSTEGTAIQQQAPAEQGQYCKMSGKITSLYNCTGLLQPWFWTSGTYNQNRWEWSTSPLPGNPFVYSNWAETRPVNYLNGYCTEINYSIFEGRWADFPCEFTNFFICEGNATIALV